MKKFIPVLKRTQIFAGAGNDEIASMLLCLDVQLHHYKKGEYVLREGEHLSDIMILAFDRLLSLIARLRIIAPLNTIGTPAFTSSSITL